MRQNSHPIKKLQRLVAALLVSQLLVCAQAQAASAKELDENADLALQRFYNEVKGARQFARQAKGLLVFPSVLKAGIGVGGEYGEGVLRIGNRTVDYYSTASASVGLQFGAQSKTVIVAFMTSQALKSFRSSPGWKAGVDGSVALLEVGKGVGIDTVNVNDPIVGFVFGNKGLMYNLTFEGSKFTKLKK